MTYVYRVTTNVCLNMLRARSVREPAASVDPTPEVGTTQGAAALEARQTLEALAKILDQRSLEVAALLYIDGLSHEEISEVLKLSRKTVGRDLARIRQAASQLEHTLEEEP